MALDIITVNDSGTQIAYTDTGAPSQSPYITMVAIHGMSFSGGSFLLMFPQFRPDWPTLIIAVFKRVQNLAIKKGVRLNRRNYPVSTPYEEEDVSTGQRSRKTFGIVINAMSWECLSIID